MESLTTCRLDAAETHRHSPKDHERRLRLITRPRNPTVWVRKDYGTEEEAGTQVIAVKPLMNIGKIMLTSFDID
jgi:hypothetical protein